MTASNRWALIVGALTIVAIWILATIGPLDRAETPVVRGGAEIGWFPLKGEETRWLPPDGAAPSRPAKGKLIVSEGDHRPWSSVQVYADGRVIWLNPTYAIATESLADGFWQERRLTPHGVELLRSGVMRLGATFHGTGSKLPASAWEDPVAKSYVAARYVVCASHDMMLDLPQQAQDLLRGLANEQAIVRGEDEFSGGWTGFSCPAVTIEEARALDRIFLEGGLYRHLAIGSLNYDGGSLGGRSLALIPLLPDRTLGEWPQG